MQNSKTKGAVTLRYSLHGAQKWLIEVAAKDFHNENLFWEKKMPLETFMRRIQNDSFKTLRVGKSTKQNKFHFLHYRPLGLEFKKKLSVSQSHSYPQAQHRQIKIWWKSLKLYSVRMISLNVDKCIYYRQFCYFLISANDSDFIAGR